MHTSIQGRERKVVFTRRLGGRYYQAVRRARAARASVAGAFRRMARGLPNQAAWAATVAFYRSSLREWAKQLG